MREYVKPGGQLSTLATAPKSNSSNKAINQVLAAITEHPKSNVPLHLRNAPTKLMKDMGYGNEYRYPHDFPNGFVPGEQYLPDELEGRKFYQPAKRGYEKKIEEWLEALRNSHLPPERKGDELLSPDKK